VTDENAATIHTVRRLAVRLGQPYADAVRRFEELVPVVDAERFFRLDSWDAVVELAAREAPLGFMRYSNADVPAFMAGSGATWDCAQYLMGTHVLAERLYRYVPPLMLRPPLRSVILASA